MPPNRSARSTRDSEIPNHFIVNWRKSDSRSGPKQPTLVRRPITACENCRTAKVRCNGQQDCQRCTSRRLVCSYGHRLSPGTEEDLSASPSASMLATGQGQPINPLSLAGVSVDGPNTAVTALSYLGSVASAYEPSTQLEPTLPIGWDDALDFNSTPYMVNTTTHHPICAHQNYGPGLSETINSDQRSATKASVSSCSPPSLGPQTSSQGVLHDSTASCPCRANLMIWVPKIARAMQDKRTDEVLKVTGEVAKHCQDIVDCKTDEVRCSDLLLIMSVLQETRPCFDYIAKSGFLEGQGDHMPVKLNFGDYEVLLHNAGVRAMLAMDLVQRAAAVVTAISNKGQNMINELAEPCNLAKANIAYLEANISHFQSMLNCVTRHVEGAVNKDEGPPAVSNLASRNVSECSTEGHGS